jgi:hypothetical protein
MELNREPIALAGPPFVVRRILSGRSMGFGSRIRRGLGANDSTGRRRRRQTSRFT